ncbi:thaumatin-like protein 1 [Olea europaea var. sylvestris]|uniref:thaumatin-like protein 1 n=1 Tax=Olea europaea var. sylvestris TaxID=158386 RepID=UPI000C1D66D5|nr:thaumatin-like protein 1 [Olea europaea var. sylvestris]XP_022876048.1 thaumatin-like protein 1 [Olea europaea var. sylvestris]
MSSKFSSHFDYITLVFLLIFGKGSLGATFTLTNRCDYTVWPGILANAGSSKLDSTGFELPSGGTRTFQALPGWSGRFWGRTHCTFDPNTGQGSCATGDCGSNQVECNGAGAAPPATLAEFTIGSGTNSGAQDFYDVSLVDGYNLPMIVQPKGGSGACGSTGCITDLNRMCPNELRAGDGHACKSACEAFGNPEYCCSGAYGSPTTCRPSTYSEIFKTACPRSYSYAYDDATGTFMCSGANYEITFCPSRTSLKSSRDPSSPETATGTTIGSNLSSWLPNFVTGDSSRTMPNFALHFTLFVTFFILLFLYI